MSIKIEISVGELLDKITILEIKKERIKDQNKLINIEKELSFLNSLWKESQYSSQPLTEEINSLKRVNEKLWEIEDEIRHKEKIKVFDENFIELARAVYVMNDKRAQIKRSINKNTNSGFIEEKSYSDYI